MAAVAESIERLDGVSRVRSVSATRPGHVLVAGLVRPRAVDPLLDELDRLGVPASGITLSRVEAVGQIVGGAAETTLVWADVLSAAWHHARPIGRYFVLMLVAGVIAAYGVTERNGILIVGAMAVSPDLLPITAISVGVVGRSPRLIGEAFVTLFLGLVGTCAAAAAGRLLPGPARSAPIRLQPGRCGHRVGGPRDGEPRDDRRRARRRNRRDAGARDSCQRGGGGGGISDHDPCRRLFRGRSRDRRARDRPRCPRGLGHERVDDGGRSLGHPRGSAGFESPRRCSSAPARHWLGSIPLGGLLGGEAHDERAGRRPPRSPPCRQPAGT